MLSSEFATLTFLWLKMRMRCLPELQLAVALDRRREVPPKPPILCQTLVPPMLTGPGGNRRVTALRRINETESLVLRKLCKRQNFLSNGRSSQFLRIVAFRCSCSVLSIPAFGASICNAGDQIVLTRIVITESCTITGSLTVHGGGMLRADFNAAPGSVLRVEGDVLVGGSGELWVERGTFEIQQDHNRHRTIRTNDNAVVVLREANVVLNQGSGLKYLVWDAFDRSSLFVIDSALDRTNSWLIVNYYAHSKLTAIGARYLPTEIYVKEGSTIRIAQQDSITGIWLNFEDGATGTFDLPAQTDTSGELRSYSWKLGRESPEITGVAWQLEIADATVGIGVESHSGSRITVNGRGIPATGELKVSYSVDEGTQTLTGLAPGLQNSVMGGGQLTLNNVNRGPIAWQIYARENEMLSIYSSILNEIGVSARGHITVYNSMFQFAGITSLGSGGASISVHNSQIHSQTIEALRDGVVDIYDSAVYGAAVVAHESTSAVNFHGGAFLSNYPDACPLNLNVMLDPRAYRSATRS